MKPYVGTKIINAEPEAREGQEGYRVQYPDGYISWSPKAVFEECYRLLIPGETAIVIREYNEARHG